MKLSQVLCSLVVSLGLFLSACNEATQKVNEKPTGPGADDNNRKTTLPLPRCAQDLLARLYWNLDRDVFGYTVEVGTQPGVYTKTYTLNPDQKAFLIAFGRGSTYYVRLNKFLSNGSDRFQTLQVVAPTCANREAYQKAHPGYKEPFDQFIGWNNK